MSIVVVNVSDVPLSFRHTSNVSAVLALEAGFLLISELPASN